MTLFIASVSAASGFALCWFIKDKIISLIAATGSFIRRIEAKIAALKAVL